ncbi:FixH family protein [Aurantibacter crassamenti]|uniref:FixH family protein n=1 Tax=Aurantibacter crassamenti TaxID=1837375 RepID=UPI00193961EA|nr:FixH family protein [Aurantibacter crassamenti]MBM1107359.1 FixH family protein [Aurantibacter crassamenti]
MKINWGTSIVIAFVAFISFILFFVFRMSTEVKAEHDLVTEDYYKDELGYQKDIDAEQNAKNLSDSMKIVVSKEGLKISFPQNQTATKISGNVFLYRPSNKQLDFDLPISLSDSNLLIPDERLLDGRWNIKVFWEYEGKSFLHKKNITY